MSKRFKVVFFIRFLGYLIFFTGLISFAAVFGPLAKAEVGYRFDKVRGVKRTIPKVITSTPERTMVSDVLPTQNNQPTASFGELKVQGDIITPVSTDFGIVIEKINANAKVVADVDSTNERDYVKALQVGVAHAYGTNYPGEKGNVYLFSHSTDAPWNIIRYNAIFYLLRELESGDRVIIFYKNRRYDYIVFDKKIVQPSDVLYLTAKYEQPVLTLQTCDPPGTLLHRLVVRARLEGS